MATALLKIKIMPESLDVNLEELKHSIENSLKAAGAIKIEQIEEQEIAFGLKALIVTLAWPEEKEVEQAEKCLKELAGVSSLDVIDYRRAFG